MTTSYVVEAILGHARLMVAKGLADGRPLRFDGLTQAECLLVRPALSAEHPSWRVFILGPEMLDEAGQITHERAVKYRNEANSVSGAPFILLSPLGVLVDSSVAEPAFYVVSRATVFREALSRLRRSLNVTASEVRSIKDASAFHEDEAVFAFLARWNKLEGYVDPAAMADHLGLLADSGLDATSVAKMLPRLRKNADVLDILMRPGTSPSRIGGELLKKYGVPATLRPHLDNLRAWIASGRKGDAPRLADLDNWPKGEGEDLALVLERDLSVRPHIGWSKEGGELFVPEPHGSAKLSWDIRGRRSGLKTEVVLIEEVSHSTFKSLGKSTNLTKLVKWSQVFGAKDALSDLRDLNPAGDTDGYTFHFLLRLLDGTKLVDEIQSKTFKIAVEEGDPNTQAGAGTAWHALYRFHAERGRDPEIIGPVSGSPTAVSMKESDGSTRHVVIELSPVLQAIEQVILEKPGLCGTWTARVDARTAVNLDQLELVHREPLATTPSFSTARAEFFERVRQGGLLETSDLRNPDLRTAALAYVEEWQSVVEKAGSAAHAGHGIAHEARLGAARLASIDTVRLRFPGEYPGEEHEVLLVSPLHPAVVAWAIGFHDLVHEWTRGVFDAALKPPYRAPASSPAALGGVEGFRAGPRAMVMYTAFENEVVPTAWAYSGSVHPMWQTYVRMSGDVESRGREWPEDLARLLQLKEVPAGGNRIDARRVGDRLKKYAILHPYVRQMRIAALVSGDGQPLLDALKVIDEKGSTPTGAKSIRELRYELQVIGPRSDRLGSAIEDLTSNPGDGRWRGYAAAVLDNPETVLAPGFAFGIHGIEWRSSNPNAFWPAITRQLQAIKGGSDVVIFGSLLTTDAHLVHPPTAAAGFAAKGLVSRPVTVIAAVGDNEPFAGNWTLVIPRPDPYASVAAATQDALMSIVDVAAGCVSQDFSVGLSVALAGPVSQTLRTAHETADWVIIADPLFSIELMDRAREDSEALLLDYTPEFDPYPAGRVIVSTDTLGKLAQVGPATSDASVASRTLAKVLSSISARLLLSLSNPTKQVVRGLHGLALTRTFFRMYFPNAVVIPMDGHTDMFAVPKVTGTRRLADLLAVSIIGGRLHFAVIESKWVGKANLGAKVTDGVEQANSSMQVLREEFLEYVGVDRELRIDALREIILFHLQRAERHGLPTPFTREALAAATANGEIVAQAQLDGHVVAWCPDIDADDDSVIDDVQVAQRGLTEIRRYLHAMRDWPSPELPDPDQAVETDLDRFYEQLIDETISDSMEQEEEQALAENTPVSGDDEEPDPPETSSLAPGGRDDNPDAKDESPEVPEPQPDVKEIVVVAPPVPQPAPSPAPVTHVATGRGIDPIHLGHRVRTAEPVEWDPSKLANGHVAVLGGSGAGKTTLLRKLGRCITNQGVPVLVLDFHGDLELPGDAFSYDFSYEGNEAFINPLHLDPAYAKEISISRLKWEFLDAWRSQYPTLGIQQRSFLARLIDDAYASAGVTPDAASWHKPVDFSDVLDAFERSDERAATKERIEAYMQQFREWAVFHGGEPINVESMLQRSTRLNLSQLDEGARNIVADVVLRRLFLLVKALGPIPEGTLGWDRFRCYVVIDEAQVLLTTNGEAKASLAKYASEARKFGIGLVLATQLRDNIPGNVWGNIDTRLWMLALDQTERQKNAKAAGLEESSLAALQVGEAFLVASSQPGTRPMHVKIDPSGC